MANRIRDNKYSCHLTYINGKKRSGKPDYLYYGKLRPKIKSRLKYPRACWAEIGSEKFVSKVVSGFIISNLHGQRHKYLETVVAFINTITKCEMFIEDKDKYIYYKPIGGYGSDLLLLNLIRHIWYPNPFSNSRYTRSEVDVLFFEELKCKFEADKDNKKFDPILLLTTLIKKYSSESVSGYSAGDHSFFTRAIKPKTTKEFWEHYKGRKKHSHEREDRISMDSFLQK